MGLSSVRWLIERLHGVPGHFYDLAAWDKACKGRPREEWPPIRCVRCPHTIWKPNI